MISNYHTHHHLCGHAMGDCEDYIKEAIKQNFKELGFSDHAPNSRVKDFGVRMLPQDFETYLNDIEYVQKKYHKQLTIKKGIEVEFFYDHEEYYQFLKEKVSYLILGQHYVSLSKTMDNLISGFGLSTKEQIKMYQTYVCDGMETGHFDILAHPDLYMCGYLDWDQNAEAVAHEICKTAEKTNTILEFNSNGFRRAKRDTPQGHVGPYPRKEFWDIVKKYDVRTILSSDCHTPEQLYDDIIKEAEEVYLKLGTKSVTFLDE